MRPNRARVASSKRVVYGRWMKPPTHWAYNADVKQYPYDLEKAKALLDDAGFVPGDDGIRANGDLRLAFTMSTSAGNQARESAQLILQQAFKEIGAEMTIDNRPASTLWTEDVPAGNYETLMVAWDNAIQSDLTARNAP